MGVAMQMHAFICIYVLCQLIWRLFGWATKQNQRRQAPLDETCYIPGHQVHLESLQQRRQSYPLFCHLHTICAYSLVWSASINTPRHQEPDEEDTSSPGLTPQQQRKSNPLLPLYINKPFARLAFKLQLIVVAGGSLRLSFLKPFSSS